MLRTSFFAFYAPQQTRTRLIYRYFRTTTCAPLVQMKYSFFKFIITSREHWNGKGGNVSDFSYWLEPTQQTPTDRYTGSQTSGQRKRQKRTNVVADQTAGKRKQLERTTRKNGTSGNLHGEMAFAASARLWWWYGKRLELLTPKCALCVALAAHLCSPPSRECTYHASEN